MTQGSWLEDRRARGRRPPGPDAWALGHELIIDSLLDRHVCPNMIKFRRWAFWLCRDVMKWPNKTHTKPKPIPNHICATAHTSMGWGQRALGHALWTMAPGPWRMGHGLCAIGHVSFWVCLLWYELKLEIILAKLWITPHITKMSSYAWFKLHLRFDLIQILVR